MGQKLQKFLLLMWKNFVLQKRHPVQTFIEIVAPVLCCSLLVLVRVLVTPKKHSARFYTPFDPSIPVLQSHRYLTILHWAPSGDLIRQFIEKIMLEINQEQGSYLLGLPSETSEGMNKYLGPNLLAFAGIAFDNDLKNRTDFPRQLNVIIRFPGELRLASSESQESTHYSWVTNLLFPAYQMPGPRDHENNEGPQPEYNREGFLKLQLLIGLHLINHLSNADNESSENVNPIIHIQMQRFPHPPWISDDILTALRLFVSLIIMLSTVYICINNVRVVTAEKEKQLKEAMMIMGLPNWLHWLAWFVKNFVMMLMGQILVVILFKIHWFGQGSILPRSNPIVILYFLCFFIAATTTFCFAISVFFSKASLAATVTGMVWFLSFFPYSFLQSQYDTLSLSKKLLACLCSTSAMGYGFQTILMFEGVGEGMQWSNIDSTISPDDTLTLHLVLVMLTFDTILYMGIAVYVEAVFPGETGVPKVWYFPFTRSYWCGPPVYVIVEDEHPLTEENEYFEREPEGLTVGIKIINLKKVYSNKRVAVQNLNLNMYRGQITVLLGHNGAGKTTTMSMLTGIVRPTNGTAIIGGYDIRNDKKRARKSIGLCPQYNVLFDELTVAEHIYFFSKLKGVKKNKINREINRYVNLLELRPKRNAQAGTLSGGMQRKLSVGIALCGNSQVVMLDEPTAGMDPSARRALWDLLISQKKDRTMLLSTHFMDEADLLGDRIAIMAHGVLQCCGSSFFLKKKYGAGYHLIMEKSADCVVADVTALLQQYIPSLQVKSEVGNELSYVLGHQHASVFEDMLNDLEDKSASLGIESYGISLTTLEEVFMMVGADSQEVQQNDVDHHRNRNYEDHSKVVLLKGLPLWLNQFKAMFTKRMLTVYRSWSLFLVQNILAVLFICLAIIVVRNVKYYGDMPPLKMSLSSYNQPITVLTGNNNYSDRYLQYLKKNNYEVIYSAKGNMSDILYNETVQNYVRVRQRYICGAAFSDSSAIVWFNSEPYHSAPLCLQMVLNTVLKEVAGDDREIQFTNHPLKFKIFTKFRDLAEGHNMGFQIAFNLAFAMALVSPFYIIFYVKERASKAKHLQFVSGVGVIAFWAPAFIVDIITFAFTSICICVALLCFDEDGFNTIPNLRLVFFALMCFAYAVFPLTYLAAFRFDIPATGYTKMCLLFVFFGVLSFFLVQVLRWPFLGMNRLADTFHYVLLLVPHYNLASFVRDSNILYVIHSVCDQVVAECVKLRIILVNRRICLTFICMKVSQCCKTTRNYYDWRFPGVGRNILYSVTVGTVLIIFLLLIEYRVIRKIRHSLRRRKYVPPDSKIVDIQIDLDVKKENDFIRHAKYEEISRYNLFMRDISKCYGKFVAVNNICLAVKKFECFGLLGLNGAGKTTTFKIMTGDIKCTSGDAWVNGVPLKGNLKKIQRKIGYCPQFDALLDDLTCRETLKIFSLLRGLRVYDAKHKADKLANEFDFSQHLDKRVYALSGGNKRKLSTAISVIGNPDVLYLDEPTTGMDPATKRFLWDELCKIRDRGVCIVLTSHSMEECEALCTRIAIMVNGMFVCMGSPQHLKTRFSEGYTLIIKLEKGVSTNEIEYYVSEQLPSAELREKHQEMLTYYIRQSAELKWSYMFGIMEKAKLDLNIEDYSIGQSSLEQVFLSFTKYQSEKYKVKGKKKRRHLEILK